MMALCSWKTLWEMKTTTVKIRSQRRKIKIKQKAFQNNHISQTNPKHRKGIQKTSESSSYSWLASASTIPNLHTSDASQNSCKTNTSHQSWEEHQNTHISSWTMTQATLAIWIPTQLTLSFLTVLKSQTTFISTFPSLNGWKNRRLIRLCALDSAFLNLKLRSFGNRCSSLKSNWKRTFLCTLIKKDLNLTKIA